MLADGLALLHEAATARPEFGVLLRVVDQERAGAADRAALEGIQGEQHRDDGRREAAEDRESEPVHLLSHPATSQASPSSTMAASGYSSAPHEQRDFGPIVMRSQWMHRATSTQ